jgi:sodium transport system permease protein
LELYWLSHNEMTAHLEENFGAVLESMQRARASLGWGVLAAVIVPAILEEIFFRGLLYGALVRRCSAWLTIVLCGLLFGVTHVVLDGALGLERLLPSTLLGWILSTVRWRTGSLWPCLILHVCHNTILLTVALYAPGSTDKIPQEWLVGGAVGTLLGAFFLWFNQPQRSSRTQAPG